MPRRRSKKKDAQQCRWVVTAKQPSQAVLIQCAVKCATLCPHDAYAVSPTGALTTTGMQRTFALHLATVLISLSLLEGVFYGIARCIPHQWYYKPPTREAFLRYLRSDIDWEVGWRPPPHELATTGYRLSPAGAGLATPCMSLYGDSFTFGSEVAPEAVWGNVLTERLGCRVDNYGVPGYGTDQAYVYFSRQHQQAVDQAPVVILSHLSENIVRNITQDYSLLYQSELALKPRFVTDDDGHLRLIKMPHVVPQDYDAYVSDMAKFLHEDYLLPSKSALSKRRIFFPHILTVPYLFTYKRFYASLLFYAFDVPPWFAELYDPGHPSHALQVTRDILVNFARDAQRYGKRPLIFVIPTARDLLYFRRTGHWIYANLLTMLQRQDAAQAMNLGPQLLAKVKDGNLCDYFCTTRTTRSGHYTVQGNRVLAEVVQEVVEKLGVLSAIK